jgi:phage terminase large subunit-like protein
MAHDYIQQLPAYETSIKYAQDVIAGRVVAGKLVVKCCVRFLRDLIRAQNEKDTCPFYFSDKAAEHAVSFFGFLRHTKGIWAKQVETSGFLLAPWQVFILTNLFGFIRKDNGQRRFREAYLEVARKNGKSTFIAGIGLYMMYADGEPGAEVYSAATTKDQAKIVFKAAQDMVKVSPFLKSRIQAWRNNLHVDESSSKFEPLASDSGTLDGLNIHCGLIDELHEHPDRTMYDVLNTATGSRSQPLIVCITTAGFTREGICWDQRDYGVKVCGGIAVDDNFFAYIACLDKDDKWDDESCWIKANPNLGISTSLEAIRPNFIKAKEQPAAQNEFLRKHLNVWTSQNTAWLLDGKWEACCAAGEHAKAIEQRKFAFDKLKGRICLGGMDLASTNDLAAVVLLFPPCETQQVPEIPAGHGIFKMASGEVKILPETNIQNLERLKAGERTEEIPENCKLRTVYEKDDKWSILPFFWIPEGLMDDLGKQAKQSYETWVRAGFIDTCPGLAISQEVIHAKIRTLKSIFRIHEVGFDPWNTGWIGPKMVEDGIKAVKVPPFYEHMSGPTKNLTALITGKAVEHYNNPVLRWNASNVQLLLDSNGNQRPDKGKSKSKIDGIVATVIAMNRALAHPDLNKKDDPDRFKVRTI